MEGVHVLLVEDDDMLRNLVYDMITDGGFTVTATDSADAALKLLDGEKAQFRALVTDVHLGSPLAGWDVARRARENNKKTAIIYMTGAGAHEWASKGVPNSLVLQKPFAEAQMLTALSQLITEVAKAD